MSQHKALYRISEAAEMLSLSRSAVYELIRAKRLRAVKEGRSTRVSADAIQDYVALLEKEASNGEHGSEAA